MALSVNFNPGSITGGFAITKSDATVFGQPTSGIYVGTAGDVQVVTEDGTTLLFKNLSAGAIHPIRAKQVMATNTTAADIVGVY